MSKEIDKCVKEYCEPYAEYQQKISEDMIKGMNFNTPTISMNKNTNKFVNNMFKELKKEAKEGKNKNTRKKEIKEKLRVCTKRYCNPGCKGTLMENGNINKLPPHYKNYKNKLKNFVFGKNKNMEQFNINIRKHLFKTRKSVLNNNFYYELKNTTVKKKKEKGAISGCTTSELDIAYDNQ